MKETKLFTDEVMRDMGKRIQIERKKKGYKAIDFADIIGIGKAEEMRWQIKNPAWAKDWASCF